jgi:hypothetical protein
MSAKILHTMRELRSRSGNGIHMRLLLSEDDGRVSVAVVDTKTPDGFTLDVRDGDRALDVFHHPLAYAAWRRVETGLAPVSPELPCVSRGGVAWERSW